MRMFMLSTSFAVALAMLTALSACTVIHQKPKPVKAVYELEINGKPVQKKTVTFEYPPDPMGEPKDE